MQDVKVHSLPAEYYIRVCVRTIVNRQLAILPVDDAWVPPIPMSVHYMYQKVHP